MKKYYKYLAFFLPSLSCFSSHAQPSKIDSLENILKYATHDTTRVNALAQLCTEYRLSDEIKKSLAYGLKGISLAKEISYEIGLAQNINNVGNAYTFQGDFTIALTYYKQAQWIWEKLSTTKDQKLILRAKRGMAAAFGNIGRTYFNLSDYPKSLEYQLKNLKINEELGNKDGIARCFRNLGDLYLQLSDYPKALSYQLRSLSIVKTLGNKRSICHSLSNIGSIYQELHDYPKAFNFQLRSFEIAKEINDKQRIGRILNDLGTIYESVSDSDCIKMSISCDDKYEKALEYQQKSLKVNEEIGDKKNIAVAFSGISSVFFKQKKYHSALEYGNKAFKLFYEIGNLKNEKDILFTLYQTYKAMGNSDKALEQYEKFVLLRDSIFKEEKQKEIMRRQMDHEYEKKETAIKSDREKERAVAATESRRQKLFIYFITTITLAVGIIAFIVFRSLRTARKQKLIIEKQKNIVDQKNKHITDSIYYAKRIQESILMNEEEVAKVLPFESFIFYQPKDIVSGDFYWLSYAKGLNSKKHVIAAADCTGHGVPGAFLSMIGNMLLNEVVNEKKITNPSEILKELHHRIYYTLHHETESAYSHDGMDISLCTVDIEKEIISYAGANNPLYIIRKDENDKTNSSFNIHVIKPDNISLGDNVNRIDAKNHVSFSTHEIPIQKGMKIYLFSDGYMDQYNQSEKRRMGSAQFKKLLLESAHLSMKEQKQYLINAFNNCMGTDKQVDDVLVIGITV